MAWDKAPVDLTFLLDAPAGKHGFLGIKGNRFVFEDGTAIRFWGTTLTGAACFPPHDLTPFIAERISQFGINLVRLHYMDADWAEPNLFADDADNTFTLDPEALDRLDYLIHQFENRGVYIFLDGLNSRKLRPGDGVRDWESIPPGMKGSVYFSQEIRKNHYDYLLALWSHRNRYTNKEYRDSPSIVMTQSMYDNNLFLDKPRGMYLTDLLDRRWQIWRQRHSLEPAPLDLQNPSSDEQRFVSDIMGEANANIANYLRSISVKIPLTASNAIRSARDLPASSVLDFTNVEGIWNPPMLRFTRFANRPMVPIDPESGGHLFSELAFARLEDKPFVVSKWGNPWPNEFRAELPLWMAATVNQQDWQGCITSTYRSVSDPEIDYIFAPLEAFNDPCLFGLMPAAALLFHSGEPKPLRQRIRVALPDSQIFAEEQVTPYSCITTRLVDHAKISVELGMHPSGRNILAPTQPDDWKRYVIKAKKGNRLIHDPKRALVLIDTPHTQAAIGRLAATTNEDFSFARVESAVDFGVVCVSSMDNESIDRSRDLLVTVVSEARNRQFQAKREQGDLVVQNVGLGPMIIKETPVRLSITTRHESWRIQSVSGAGTALGIIPHTVENGWLSFDVGVHGTLYYRLSCQSGE